MGNKIISMSDTIYAEGFNIYEPRKEAPDWVAGNVVVRVEEFVKFLEEHKTERGEVRFTLAPRKAGGTTSCLTPSSLTPARARRRKRRRNLRSNSIP